MKPIPSLLVMVLLLSAGTCLAMISVEPVSKKRAQELGIEVRGKANGPKQAWIEMEFKPEGKLDNFMHVSLEIRDGEKFQLGWTPLKSERTATGSVIVRLMADRTFLEQVTLRIVRGATGDVGHDVKIADFVDLKGL